MAAEVKRLISTTSMPSPSPSISPLLPPDKGGGSAGGVGPVESILLMLLGYESSLFVLAKLNIASSQDDIDSTDGDDGFPITQSSDNDDMDYSRFYILHNNHSKCYNKLFKWFTDLGNILNDCRCILFDEKRSCILSDSANNCVAREVYSSSLDLLTSIEGELSILINTEKSNSPHASNRFKGGVQSSASSFETKSNSPWSNHPSKVPQGNCKEHSESASTPASTSGGYVRLVSLYRRCRGWLDLLKTTRDLLISCQFDRSSAVKTRQVATPHATSSNVADVSDKVASTGQQAFSRNTLVHNFDDNASYRTDASSIPLIAGFNNQKTNIANTAAAALEANFKTQTTDIWNKIVLDALFNYHDLISKLCLPEKISEVCCFKERPPMINNSSTSATSSVDLAISSPLSRNCSSEELRLLRGRNEVSKSEISASNCAAPLASAPKVVKEENLKLWLVNDASLQIVEYYINRMHSAASSAYLKFLFSNVFSSQQFSASKTAAPFPSPDSMAWLFSRLNTVRYDFKYLQRLVQPIINIDETSLGDRSGNKDVKYSYFDDFQTNGLNGVIEKSFLTMYDEKSYYKDNDQLLNVMLAYKPFLTGRPYESLNRGVAADRSRLGLHSKFSEEGFDKGISSLTNSCNSAAAAASSSDWSVPAEVIVEAKSMVSVGGPASSKVHIRRAFVENAATDPFSPSSSSASHGFMRELELDKQQQQQDGGVLIVSKRGILPSRRKPLSISSTLNQKFNGFVRNNSNSNSNSNIGNIDSSIGNSSDVTTNLAVMLIKNDENSYNNRGAVSTKGDSCDKIGQSALEKKPSLSSSSSSFSPSPEVLSTLNLFSHWVSLNLKYKSMVMRPLVMAVQSVSSQAALRYLRDNEILLWLRYFRRVFLMIDGSSRKYNENMLSMSFNMNSGQSNHNNSSNCDAVYSYEIWDSLHACIDNLVWSSDALVVDNSDGFRVSDSISVMSQHSGRSGDGAYSLSSSINSFEGSSINTNTFGAMAANKGVTRTLGAMDSYISQCGSNLISISQAISDRLKGLTPTNLQKSRSSQKSRYNDTRRSSLSSTNGSTTPVKAMTKTPSPAKYRKPSPNVANVDERSQRSLYSPPSKLSSPSSPPSSLKSPSKSTRSPSSSSSWSGSWEPDCHFFINTMSPLSAIQSLISKYGIDFDRDMSMSFGMHAFAEFLCSTLGAGTIVHAPLAEVISQKCVAMYSILHHYVIRMMCLKWASDSLWKKIVSSSLPVRMSTDGGDGLFAKSSSASHCFSLFSLNDNIAIAGLYLDLLSQPPPPPLFKIGGGKGTNLATSPSSLGAVEGYIYDNRQIDPEIAALLTDVNLDKCIKFIRSGISLLYHIVRYCQEKLFSIIQNELCDPLMAKFEDIILYLSRLEDGAESEAADGDGRGGEGGGATASSQTHRDDFSLGKMRIIHEECLSNSLIRVTSFFPERLSDIYSSYSQGNFADNSDNKLLSRIIFHCWEVIDGARELSSLAKKIGVLKIYLDFKQQQLEEKKRKTTDSSSNASVMGRRNLGGGGNINSSNSSSSFGKSANATSSRPDKSSIIISDPSESLLIVKNYFASLQSTGILCEELQSLYLVGKDSLFDNSVEEEQNRIRAYAAKETSQGVK